jgi:hypothetical protein
LQFSGKQEFQESQEKGRAGHWTTNAASFGGMTGMELPAIPPCAFSPTVGSPNFFLPFLQFLCQTASEGTTSGAANLPSPHERPKTPLPASPAMDRSLLAAFALLLLVPAAAPQATPPANPAEVALLQDAAGDASASAAGVSQANPSPRFAQVDLLRAAAAETAADIRFTIAVASLDPATEPPLAESAFYSLNFLQGDVHYAVQVGRVKSQEVGVWAMLSRYDPAQDNHYAIDYVPAEADVASATFHVTVPRDLLVDSHGARPYPGSALTGFWAESRSFLEVFTSFAAFAGGPPPTFRDRMPDAGNGTVPLPIALGPVQAGSARLSSPLPVRQSNGEATTFLYTVEARNVGGAEESYRLAPRGVPPGWNVTLEVDEVTLAAGASETMPVLVGVPFMHEHGTFRMFTLTMQALGDTASKAELELGVRYPKVPQPAGHHDTLYLHGAKWTDDPSVLVWATLFGFNTEYAWMNADEADPGDTDTPVPADGTFKPVPAVPDTFRWTVPLAPDLAIGLDFDLARSGLFSGAFTATTPLLGATASGELVHYVDSRYDEFGTRVAGNRTVLARLAASTPQDIAPNGRIEANLPVQAAPEADLVALRPRSALVLELNLTGMRPDTFEARDPPKLLPGATLQLPLREYHDPVDALFATPKLSLRSAGPQDRIANPGDTVVFPFTVRLAADAGDHPVRLRLAEGADVARLLGPPERILKAGEAWNVSVAVQVPAGTPEDAAFGVRLHAAATDAPGLRALARLRVTATTTQEVPDEAALAAQLDQGQPTKSPMPMAPVAALLVAGLAGASRGWARARRRA